jgi:hypothetical protein
MVTPINNISAVPRLRIFHAPGRFFKLDPNQLKLYNNQYLLRRKRVCRNDLYHCECGFFDPLPVCFFCIMIKWRQRLNFARDREASFPYERADTLISPNQQSILFLLEKALDERYSVFSKIRLQDVVRVNSDLSPGQQKAAMKRLTSEPLDFVICEKENAAILGIVLLDGEGASPENGRVRRETDVDRVLAAAGIPVVHLNASKAYSLDDIRIEVSRTIFLKWKLNKATQLSEPVNDNGMRKNGGFGSCPVCGAAFIKRVARKGAYAGKHFLACSNYPQCKHVRLVKDDARLREAQR